MKIPNGSQAIIHPDKLRGYLLNVEHKRGTSKASLLLSFGYTPENWQVLGNDLQQYHLTADVTAVRETPYGTRYEIRAFLITPNGRSLMVRTIWQVNTGTEYPRFITLFPD
ncbi:MAG: hypothetical protein GY796_34515 [Chloroflexi bacterium]|nr:hypothetical protein [Chloroflexota bacterium]